MIKNLFRKFSISIFFLFILFFIFFSLPPKVEALDCDGFPWTGVFCDPWENLGCGVNPCPTTAMKSQRACITCYLGLIVASGMQYKCDMDYPSCQTPTPVPPPPTAICGSWVDGSCGGGSCPSNERFQSRYCILGTITYPETRCVRDSACVGGTTPAPTPTSDPQPTSPPSSGGCTPGEWSASRCATCKSNRSWNANCTDYGSASTWCACASWCDSAAYTANTACKSGSSSFTCP